MSLFEDFFAVIDRGDQRSIKNWMYWVVSVDVSRCL